MRKVKYFYNPETLSYEKYRPGPFKRLLNLGGFLFLALFLALSMLVTVFNYYDTPQERVLKQEINQYETQFRILNSRVQEMNQTVKELEYKDNNIYRVIFEADPIPMSIREGGFGGADRYTHLEGFDNSEIIVRTARNLDQMEKQLQILSNSFNEIRTMAYNKEDMLAAIPAIQPVSNEDLNRIASGFGRRMHPIYKTVRHHDGIDFSAPTGTEVFATGEGKVVKTRKSRRGYGNHVIIDHGFGYETLYAHLNEIHVNHGDEIQRGELIGTVGNSGMSVAPHLHYEVRKNGRPVDPINFFHNDLEPEEYEQVIILANQANQSLD